jgi:CxxC motif-containing protein
MKMICINCPRGCEMTVEEVNSRIVVQGNACPRGENYAISEMTHPERMVTVLVKVAGRKKPLPVKTSKPVLKSKISEVLQEASCAVALLPVKIGDVIVVNVAKTGANLVATANMA